MRIASNIAALNATNIKSKNINLHTKSIEKLSSGMRVNKASDDAAGLSISQKMRAQIRGLSQASRNAQDGISLIQTAEGAVGEMTQIAQRMRELCVQAANGTLTNDDRNKIQLELESMKAELSSISNKTEFNTKKLLNGSVGNSSESISLNLPLNMAVLPVGQSLNAPILIDGHQLETKILKNADLSITITVEHQSQILGTTNVLKPTAVSPHLQWSNTFGSSNGDISTKLIKTNDGGYLIAGIGYGNDGDLNINNGLPGFGDGWLIKVDSNGDEQWKENYGGSGHDYIRSVIQTSDNGYAMLVSSTSSDQDFPLNDGEADLWLVKLNADGSVSNKVRYAGTEFDGSYRSKLFQEANGNFTIFTSSESTDGDFSQVPPTKTEWILRTDSSGNILWKKTYAGSNDSMESVEPTKDGGYYVTTWAQNSSDFYSVPVGNTTDAGVIRLDNSGNVIWKARAGGTGHDEYLDIKETPDGGCIVVGMTESHDGDFPYHPTLLNYGVVVKYDSTGHMEWNKSFKNPWFRQVDVTTDGYILTGITTSWNTDASESYGLSDLWVVKLDTNGNLTHEKTLGGSLQELWPSAVVNNDDSLTFLTSSYSNDNDVNGNKGDADIWIGKFSGFNSAGNAAYPVQLDLSDFTADKNTYKFNAFELTFSSADLTSIGSVKLNVSKYSNDNVQGIHMQVGANAGQSMLVVIDDMRPEALGFLNGMPKVNPIEMAGVSITLTDQAIKKLSSQRSTLGSYQNRLEHVIKNLDSAAENLQAAESRIVDLDMAKGVTEMTKLNILNQVADAMIAQANQLPQGVLQLLK